MNVYGGAGHSFTNPGVGAAGHARLRLSRRDLPPILGAMLDLFDEALGDPGGA